MIPGVEIKPYRQDDNDYVHGAIVVIWYVDISKEHVLEIEEWVFEKFDRDYRNRWCCMFYPSLVGSKVDDNFFILDPDLVLEFKLRFS